MYGVNNNKTKSVGILINKDSAFIMWVIFLSCIIIPLAVIVNFNIGNNQFKTEMIDHWPDYQPSAVVPSIVNNNNLFSLTA